MKSETRIITLYQPWASLWGTTAKRYETRSWHTNYVGKIICHAAARSSCNPVDGMRTLIDHAKKIDKAIALPQIWAALEIEEGDFDAIAQLPTGKCISLMEILSSEMVEDIKRRSDLELVTGFWTPGRYGFKSRRVAPIVEPVPWRGGQRIRFAPPQLKSLVYEQIAPLDW